MNPRRVTLQWLGESLASRAAGGGGTTMWMQTNYGVIQRVSSSVVGINELSEPFDTDLMPRLVSLIAQAGTS